MQVNNFSITSWTIAQ